MDEPKFFHSQLTYFTGKMAVFVFLDNYHV